MIISQYIISEITLMLDCLSFFSRFNYDDFILFDFSEAAIVKISPYQAELKAIEAMYTGAIQNIM